MSDEAKVRELFASSRSRAIDLDGQHFKVDRERAISSMLRSAGAAVSAAERRRKHWFAAAAVVLAAAAGAIIWRAKATPPGPMQELLLSDVHGSVFRWNDGRSIPTDSATRIPKTGELVTLAGSSARLKTEDGLSLELREQSRLTLPGLANASSRNVGLLAGSIRCDVPHLGPGQEFAVTTPDATVVVRGTAFSVMVRGVADAARTCVKVDRGLVLVKTRDAQSLVGVGQSWGCASPAPAASGASDGAATAASRALPIVKPASSVDRPARDRRPDGTLEQQNRLFQAGLAAERAGDERAARLALEALLSKYPGSPLAADARVALARVQRKVAAPP